MFSIISAVGKNKEIGKDNQLIFHIKDDMAFFREKTLEHKVVMGQNTWNSLPKKLEKRENIVVSYSDVDGPDYIIHDIDDFIEKNKDTDEEIFIIGGATIYREFLPYVKKMYLTEIDASCPDATVFFPDFDTSSFAKTILKEGKENDLAYVISEYKKA